MRHWFRFLAIYAFFIATAPAFAVTPRSGNDIGSRLAGVMEDLYGPLFLVVAAVSYLVGFIMLFSKWLLPGSVESEDMAETRRRYGAEFTIPAKSPLVGKTLKELGFAKPVGFQLLSVQRSDGSQSESHSDILHPHLPGRQWDSRAACHPDCGGR